MTPEDFAAELRVELAPFVAALRQAESEEADALAIHERITARISEIKKKEEQASQDLRASVLSDLGLKTDSVPARAERPEPHLPLLNVNGYVLDTKKLAKRPESDELRIARDFLADAEENLAAKKEATMDAKTSLFSAAVDANNKRVSAGLAKFRQECLMPMQYLRSLASMIGPRRGIGYGPARGPRGEVPLPSRIEAHGPQMNDLIVKIGTIDDSGALQWFDDMWRCVSEAKRTPEKKAPKG